jgi:2-polyprenyl-3-methyl-5-hydroxy-6-metoxy-1,4-benzoquinol methylase
VEQRQPPLEGLVSVNASSTVPGRSARVRCRGCGTALHHVFVDLGSLPIANDFLRADQLQVSERIYPLCVYVCENCLLVQIEQFETPDAIFNADYAYFSSYSDSWVQHARDYADMMIRTLCLDASHRVIEIASNDGYLLQWFQQKGISVLGIEPSVKTAQVAEAKGIQCLTRFFGMSLAEELAMQDRCADLLIGNNVLAHVPDILDFVAGMKRALKPSGTISVEFPHFLNLFLHTQFDTIYHEHFSYLSLLTVQRIFAATGLTIFDVEEIPTHGGSLRVFARHAVRDCPPISARVEAVLTKERSAGLERLETYHGFGERVSTLRASLLELLRNLKRTGAQIAGYGAPAKGNTLLNYCGIGADLISFTVDRSPVKQGRFLPGSRIPISHPDRIRSERPDYVLILPWNLQEEIMSQIAGIRQWGGRFIIPIPQPTVIS